MTSPRVDVVIAVHSATRPIARAVGSVLGHTRADVRVIVVAHNIDREVIRANLGSWADDERVLLLDLRDGIPSPSGPMNHGFDAATGDFVALLGSDDEFEPGAIDSWLALQRAADADVVIAQIRHEGGGKELSPPARPRRSIGLHPVKDRLAYRSAPLGLVSRARFGDLRFPAGLASGEDLPYVTALWFSGARIAFARSGPGYLVHADAADRVTSGPRTIAADFAFLDHIIDAPRFAGLDKAERGAIAIKIIRMHVFDALVNRAQQDPWPEGERAALAGVVRRILAWGGPVDAWLSLIDHKVLDGILDEVTPVDELMDLLRRRWNYRSADVVLTRNPVMALHRQGPLRTYVGGYFV